MTANDTIQAMILGRTLYDFLRKEQKYSLDDCITVGNEIKKAVYDERERLHNIHDSSHGAYGRGRE